MALGPSRHRWLFGDRKTSPKTTPARAAAPASKNPAAETTGSRGGAPQTPGPGEPVAQDPAPQMRAELVLDVPRYGFAPRLPLAQMPMRAECDHMRGRLRSPSRRERKPSPGGADSVSRSPLAAAVRPDLPTTPSTTKNRFRGPYRTPANSGCSDSACLAFTR